MRNDSTKSDGARILIAGTHSGVGKTTIAAGIMAALARRGLRVQGFKAGPDFIDPAFHRAATERPGRNLDGWMLSRETNLEIFARASADADVAVIEGVMGLFDGKGSPSMEGSTAEIAIWLDAAVVLVLDASAMAGSAAAVVHGFETLLPDLKIAAVICNNVAGRGHYEYLRAAIAARCSAEPVGYLPRDANFSIPERHLGLHLADEFFDGDRMAGLGDWIEAHLDLDGLIELSRRPRMIAPCGLGAAPVRARIGVARDPAFCFYYEDNLDALRQAGAEIVEFSPLADRELPAGVDGIYLGGGYPELHAHALAANESMRRAIAEFIANGAPVYAECGGFMYLTAAIVDLDNRSWPMVGTFPTVARMHSSLAKIGYAEVETIDAPGQRMRGHEFRHSVIDPMPASVERVYAPPAEGYRVRAAIGSYVHLHFLSCPQFAARFVDLCARRK